MINNLLPFLKRVKIYFSSWLYPFEEEMRRELLFLTHNTIILLLGEKLLDKFAVISFPYKDASLINLLALVQIDIV
jgi:hypothetical protein